MRPFFEKLGQGYGNKFGGKAIYLNFCVDGKQCDEEIAKEKSYIYLLDPFDADNQIIAYGSSEDFFDVLGTNSGVGCSIDPTALSATKGEAFENTKRELDGLTEGMTSKDIDTYRFINLFRILSQLNISPSHFDKLIGASWGERIKNIYFEWKNDSGDAIRQMFETEDQISESIVEDTRYNNWGSRNRNYLAVVKDIRPLISEWRGRHATCLTGYLSWRKSGVSRDVLDENVGNFFKIAW